MSPQALRIPASAHGPALELLASGPAPRLLLVHGANASARMWLPLMAELARRGVSAWAPSLRGHGGSDGADRLQAWGLDDYLADLRRALVELDRPAVVVGHSMGGLLAQRACVPEPAPAQRSAAPGAAVASAAPAGLLLLASAPAHGMLGDAWWMTLRNPFAVGAAIRQRSFAPLYRDPETCRALLFTPRTPQAVVDACRAEVEEESWRAVSELAFALPQPQRVTCPVCVAGGSEDALVSAASVRLTAAAYRVEPVLFAGRGHMLPVEPPLGEVVELIAGFVARCLPAGG